MATNKIEVAFHNTHDQKLGHGSGFWINTGDELLFATNRHVVDIEFHDQKYHGHGYALSSVKILTFDSGDRPGKQSVVDAVVFTHESPEIDIALMRVLRVMNPENISVVPVGADVVADSHFLESELEWGAQVSFSSFQPWRDTQTERPIVRTGVLASDPAYPFDSDRIQRAHVHLLEAFSFEGASGSPVFANAKGIKVGSGLSGGNFREAMIIGIMTGHLLNEDSDAGAPYKARTGLSFCHRSDLLLSMLRDVEALQQSSFNVAV